MSKQIPPGSPYDLSSLYGGVQDLSRLVETTYGPDGRTVLIAKLGKVIPTTDGAAVAKECRPQGGKRLGVSLIRSASDSVERQWGDGTSTTILVASALVKSSRYYAMGVTPIELAQGIRVVATTVESKITEMSLKATEGDLRAIAENASHGDQELASLVVEAVVGAGLYGSVTIAAWEGRGLELEVREGLVLGEGWCTSSLTDGGPEHTMEGPLVAVVATPVLRFADIAPVLETASQWPGRGLVLFAPMVGGEAVSTMVMNHKGGVFHSMGVGYRGNPRQLSDWLADVAALTGATVVDPVCGYKLSDFQGEWLGSARKVVVTKDKTTVLGYDPAPDALEERIRSLVARADSADHDYDRDDLKRRAAALDGGLRVLRVGGVTESEAAERRARAEDTLHAVNAAIQTGVFPGAGIGLLGASLGLGDTPWSNAVRVALEHPFKVLAARSGKEPLVELERVRGLLAKGANAVDLTTVKDPTGVVLGAFTAAVSVALQIVLTAVVVPSKKEGFRPPRGGHRKYPSTPGIRGKRT